jgi:hypothetical protein
MYQNKEKGEQKKQAEENEEGEEGIPSDDSNLLGSLEFKANSFESPGKTVLVSHPHVFEPNHTLSGFPVLGGYGHFDSG